MIRFYVLPADTCIHITVISVCDGYFRTAMNSFVATPPNVAPLHATDSYSHATLVVAALISPISSCRRLSPTYMLLSTQYDRLYHSRASLDVNSCAWLLMITDSSRCSLTTSESRAHSFMFYRHPPRLLLQPHNASGRSSAHLC